MSCSEHTTSFLSDSTSGIARPAGTGVTSPTHSEESRGVSSGTMEATLKTRVSGGTGGTSETTQHITGRYLGPCDGK